MDSDSSAIATPTRLRFRLLDWFQRHEKHLWWLHSLYALFLGVGIMWLGNRNYGFLRFTVLQVSFIWLSSLALRRVMGSPRLSPRWAGWIRAVINYFNKNFYQQVMFFVLPIYYASATVASRNFFFVVLVALSATLSSLDLVYDRVLSVQRGLNAIFFAFNLFVLINVTLPVLWSMGNAWAMRVSGVLALAGFATLYFPAAPFRRGKGIVIAISAVLLGVLIELGRGYVPPAPLQLVWSEFGTEFDRTAMHVTAPLQALELGGPARLYGVTAIRAPLGLKEKVRHRWYLDGKLIFASTAFEITGGREGGFRLWTICSIEKLPAGAELHIDAETEGGQLIGRARIGVRE